jgi:transcriptional regulator with GAF, ATPase, and Fis domain
MAVLIEGETGVGKEVVAAAVHQASRRTGPLVPLNCAALPAAIADSELFGHVAGAYTGAAGASAGLFASARGGTLFLDEIGELPLEIQAKLLRALASREVRPVGGTEPVKIDVRVIAATHRDLDAEVAAGRFRADLLARLGGWRIRVPPLRERRDDVLLLAGAFLAREGGTTQLSALAAEALVLHDWPYNVRELEQAMRAAAVRAGSTGPVRVDHLPDDIARRVGDRITRTGASRTPLAAQIDRSVPPSREVLQRVLEHHGGSVAETARFFGKDRRQIYRWADRLGVPLRKEDQPDS